MARPTAELAFTAIRIEGGLLAADFLDRVARLDAKEQTEADYDTPKGLKLRDEIARYFKIALSLWQEFQGGRERTDQDPYPFTLRSFLEPFCRQVLGFADLRPTPPFTLGERVFPIGFQALCGRVPLVFAVHSQALDKPDARFGDGQRRRSAFLLAQEFLNACDASLWAIVSNGLKLRILRDNPSLTRPAYLEVDLETIFQEEWYPDVTAFWLFAHASRFGTSGGLPHDCPLERWRDASQEAGVRARDRLRLGVAKALRSLGTGFMAHPNNGVLRDRLARGELSAHGLYEQLLRLVYRLLFLATVEDRRAETGRRLVFAPEAISDRNTGPWTWATPARFGSGGAEGLDQVQPGRPQRRQQASQKPHEEGERQGFSDDRRGEFEPEGKFREGLPIHRRKRQKLHGRGQPHAGHAPDQGQQQRLRQERGQDSAAAKAQGAQGADFPGSAGHRPVHGDDGADDGAQGKHDAQGHSENGEKFRHLFRLFGVELGFALGFERQAGVFLEDGFHLREGGRMAERENHRGIAVATEGLHDLLDIAPNLGAERGIAGLEQPDHGPIPEAEPQRLAQAGALEAFGDAAAGDDLRGSGAEHPALEQFHLGAEGQPARGQAAHGDIGRLAAAPLG